MAIRDENLIWREAVIERLTRIEASLMPKEILLRMQGSFEAFQKFLGGNGAPGLCQVQAEEIAGLRDRIEDLHNKQSWMTGIGVGVSMAISAALAWLGLK
jgi:hypothetical protein